MSPRCFAWEKYLVTAALLLVGVSAWLTVHRHERYVFADVTHADLYQLHDMARVEAFVPRGKDRLEIQVANFGDRAWSVGLQGGEARRVDGAFPVLDLKPGRHDYHVRGEQSGRELRLWVESVAAIPRPIVGGVSLPIAPDARYGIADFALPPSAMPARSLARAKELNAAAGVKAELPSIEKVKRIAAYLHGQLEPHRGPPSPHMRKLDGYGQYEAAMAGRSGVRCANHAEIYAFMASAAGVPTRIIDIAGRKGGVDLGAHTFTESYLLEQNQWAFVDLQLHLAGVREPGGRYLSGADILEHNLRLSGPRDLVAHHLVGSNVEDRAFGEANSLVAKLVPGTGTLIYHWASALRFTPVERLERLLLAPEPGYSLASRESRVRVRLLMTYLAALGVLVWLVLRVRHHLRRRSCHAKG